MNLKDRIEIELARNYTPILNDALACIVELNYDNLELQAIYNTLESFDLPTDLTRPAWIELPAPLQAAA